MEDFKKIVEKINEMAKDYDVGDLHNKRAELGKRRYSALFDLEAPTLKENYAYHKGGRKELQFNICLAEKENYLRYGVAFSFRPSGFLKDPISILRPKVKLFNEYIDNFPDVLSGLDMWFHDEKECKSEDSPPRPIPDELIKEGFFVFLGKRRNSTMKDYSGVLETLDRLLPLYLYIENNGYKVDATKGSAFQFSPGCTEKPSSTSGKRDEAQFDIRLKHNDMQAQLHKQLSEEYGDGNVGAENSMNGVKIDVVVKQGDEYWFYEIKTASTVRACIRQALGQILEYSYWPGHQQAKRLIVVGEPEATKEEEEYINRLRDEFNLPIEYRQFKPPSGH